MRKGDRKQRRRNRERKRDKRDLEEGNILFTLAFHYSSVRPGSIQVQVRPYEAMLHGKQNSSKIE